MSRAHAARHRATPSGGIAPRLIFVPVSACRRSVDDRQPGRCGQPCVNRCRRRRVSATRRQSASVSGGPPSTYVITTRPSANSRPSVVGIGTGTVRPSRSRCWRSSVSHARSARSWHRDDQPRGAPGRARSTRRWQLRQRVVRCELRPHPTARVPPIPLATFSRCSGHRSCEPHFANRSDQNHGHGHTSRPLVATTRRTLADEIIE